MPKRKGYHQEERLQDPDEHKVHSKTPRTTTLLEPLRLTRQGRVDQLCFAASRGELGSIKRLLDAKTPTNRSSQAYGGTPITAAMDSENNQSLIALIFGGAEMSKADFRHLGLFSKWSSTERRAIYDLYLTTYKEPFFHPNLILVCQDSPHLLKTIQHEKGKGSRVLYENIGFGDLFIHYAAANGAMKVLKFFVDDSGKKYINAVDQEGYSPFLLAVRNGHIEAARFLLANGANKGQRTHKGENALMLAAQYAGIEMFNFLLENNIGEMHNTDAAYAPVLFHAVSGRHWQIIQKVILADKDSAEAIDCQGYNFLHYAIGTEKSNHFSFLSGPVSLPIKEALIKPSPYSPLMHAAGLGRLGILKSLHHKYGSILRLNSGYNAAFLTAVKFGRIEVMQWMLEKGLVTLACKNRAGKNALQIAQDHKQEETAEWLVQNYGAQLAPPPSSPAESSTPLPLMPGLVAALPLGGSSSSADSSATPAPKPPEVDSSLMPGATPYSSPAASSAMEATFLSPDFSPETSQYKPVAAIPMQLDDSKMTSPSPKQTEGIPHKESGDVSVESLLSSSRSVVSPLTSPAVAASPAASPVSLVTAPSAAPSPEEAASPLASPPPAVTTPPTSVAVSPVAAVSASPSPVEQSPPAKPPVDAKETPTSSSSSSASFFHTPAPKPGRLKIPDTEIHAWEKMMKEKIAGGDVKAMIEYHNYEIAKATPRGRLPRRAKSSRVEGEGGAGTHKQSNGTPSL